MASPNRFIINTDYMTFARSGNYSKLVIIPSGYFNSTSTTANGEVDINIPAPKGSISRTSASYKGVDSGIDITASSGSAIKVFGDVDLGSDVWTYLQWDIFWMRKDSKTLAVYWYVKRDSTSSPDRYVSIPITLNVSYFFPPNLS